MCDNILDFKQAVTNFSIEELENQIYNLRQRVGNMMIAVEDQDIWEKLAIAEEELESRRKENKNG